MYYIPHFIVNIQIIFFSRILVMDSGKVVEFESPNVLLQNKNSYFYNLMQQEFK